MKKKWPKNENRGLFRNLQKRLKDKLIIHDDFDRLKTLLAIDTSYRGEYAYTTALTWNIEETCPLKMFMQKTENSLPYISGMFFIRELPPISRIILDFSIEFDILLLNAAGTAHPQGLGLASHAGIFFKRPSFGISKRIPYGFYTQPSVEEKSFRPILGKDNNIIGYVLRSMEFVKPIFITPGHKITPNSALDMALQLPYIARFPEPLRLVDVYSRKEFKEEIKEWRC